MLWISVVALALAAALVQLGATIVKVSLLTTALKFLAALLVLVLMAAAAHAIWHRVKDRRSS